MAKKRKTEMEETVMDYMGADMQKETSNGRGDDEQEQEEPS